MEPRSQSSAADAAPPDTLEAALLEHLDAIERFAARIARGSGFRPAEVEDFVGSVRLKLVDDDYAVLRKHRGESSLRGYLKMVVSNHLRDERNRLLGKYRPSVAAKREGPEAVQLDRYLRRDGFDTETAVRMVRERHPRGRSAEQLRRLAERLPEHVSRRFVSDEELPERGEPGDAEERVEDEERADVRARVEAILSEALATLPTQDRMILQMIFRHGVPISKIARLLDVRQRSLYTRRDRCLTVVRRALAADGLTLVDVRGILDFDLEIDWGNPGSGPSPAIEGGDGRSGRDGPETPR